jgi:hypothetical protein
MNFGEFTDQLDDDISAFIELFKIKLLEIVFFCILLWFIMVFIVSTVFRTALLGILN